MGRIFDRIINVLFLGVFIYFWHGQDEATQHVQKQADEQVKLIQQDADNAKAANEEQLRILAEVAANAKTQAAQAIANEQAALRWAMTAVNQFRAEQGLPPIASTDESQLTN